VKSQADLKNGQKYIGETHQVRDSKGNITDYRADGSIMFSNESDAYARIWNNTQKTGNEEMGVITNNGVLVLPDYKNDKSTVPFHKYQYNFKNGNAVDAAGNTYNTLGTIHTHPRGGLPSTWDGDNFGDLGFASFKTPYKPAYVLPMNGANNISFIVAAPNTTMLVADFKYIIRDITRDNPSANIWNLISGKISLISTTKNNNFHNFFK
jgi:hypothetical protein